MSNALNPAQFATPRKPGTVGHMNDIVDDPGEAAERQKKIDRVMSTPVVRD